MRYVMGIAIIVAVLARVANWNEHSDTRLQSDG
jgi:hypothetical protein